MHNNVTGLSQDRDISFAWNKMKWHWTSLEALFTVQSGKVTGFTENNPNQSTHPDWQIPLLHQPYLPVLRSTSFLFWHNRWLGQKVPAANMNLHFAKLSHNYAKALEAWLSSSPVKSWTFIKFCHCVAVWQLGDVNRQMSIKVRQNSACTSTDTQVTKGERPMH